VNHLSDSLNSSDVAPDRQTTLDGQVRARIQSELARLREEEQSVREEIEHALQKENLDKERAMAGKEAESNEAGESGDVKSSAVLQGDLEEIQRKVDRYHTKRDLEAYPEVRVKAEAVASCYRCVGATLPLLYFVDRLMSIEQTLRLHWTAGGRWASSRRLWQR
jgi:altered-inheritance-of-mitochondria protein 13